MQPCRLKIICILLFLLFTLSQEASFFQQRFIFLVPQETFLSVKRNRQMLLIYLTKKKTKKKKKKTSNSKPASVKTGLGLATATELVACAATQP